MKLSKDEIKELFSVMVSNLDKVQFFHSEKLALYEGSYNAQVLNVVKNAKIRQIIQEQLSWGRVGVDSMMSVTVFDAFENDSIGATRLFVDCGGDRVFESARRNSMIGACSFVALIPRADSLPVMVPYTGREATGLKELRGQELEYGLAIKSYENSYPKEYYFFSPGEIIILDNNGNVIDGIELPVSFTPFVEFTWDSDLATKEHGRSLLSSAFKSSLDTSLNSLALFEQASITNVLKSDTFIMNGKESDFNSAEVSGLIDNIRVLYNNNLNSQGSVDIKHPSVIDTSGLSELFELSIRQCAVSLGVHPSALGSKENVRVDQEPVFTSKRDMARNDYSGSLLELSRKLFELSTGVLPDSFSELGVVYREPFDITRVGQLGDAIMKIRQDSSFTIDETFINRQLGIPIRREVLQQSYRVTQNSNSNDSTVFSGELDTSFTVE